MSFKALVIFLLIITPAFIPKNVYGAEYQYALTNAGSLPYPIGATFGQVSDQVRGMKLDCAVWDCDGISEVTVWFMKQGSPSDGLVAVIMDGDDGTQTSQNVSTNEVLASSLSTTLLTPQTFYFNPQDFSGSYIWISFVRTGSLNESNFYRYAYNPMGYGETPTLSLDGSGMFLTPTFDPETGDMNVSADATSDLYATFVYDTTPPDTTTRIIDFDPQDNSTTTSPVNFNLHAYINPDDLTTIKGVRLTLHNIDQNVILLGSLSNSDIYLFEGNATTSGDFYFSTSTPIGDGNYRLEACIERSYFFGWIINIFSPINDCQSHQFVVGEETFIGHISQSIWTETQSLFASSTATSTTALAGSCNPLSGSFSVTNCGAFLFVPDGKGLSDTMKSAREGILSRVPWGYLTRLYYLMNNSATSTLPTFTTTIQVGPGDDMTPEQTTLSFDVGDMVAGAGALVDSIEDPIHGQTFRDVFYPIVQLVVALGVIITIVSDITGSHRHADGGEVRQTKLS